MANGEAMTRGSGRRCGLRVRRRGIGEKLGFRVYLVRTLVAKAVKMVVIGRKKYEEKQMNQEAE